MSTGDVGLTGHCGKDAPPIGACREGSIDGISRSLTPDMRSAMPTSVKPGFAFASPPAATYVSLAAILKDCAVPNLEFPVSPGSSKA